MWWLPPHFGPKTLATRLPLSFVSIWGLPWGPWGWWHVRRASHAIGGRERSPFCRGEWAITEGTLSMFLGRTFLKTPKNTIKRGGKSKMFERVQKLKMEDTMDTMTFALLTSRLVGFEIFGAGSNFSREVARCKVNKGRWSHVCPPEAPHINIC